MSDKPLALLTIPLAPHLLAPIEEVATVRQLAAPFDRARVAEALAEAEGWLTSNLYPIDAALLDAAPRLRVVSGVGVGYNNIDLLAATARNIAVCNTPDVLTAAVADYALLLMLAAAKRFDWGLDHVRSGAWSERRPFPGLGFDLVGKTLGIIGLGRIGRAIVPWARVLGMNVVFYDLFEDPGDADAEFRPLDDLLRESDIVSLSVNLTDETTGLIGARELALMKPSAWLINTSRGPVVDQRALAEALNAGTIAGAALDVLEVEPPPTGDPILSAKNAIITPHIATATTETRAAMFELAVANLCAVLAREHPRACVNPDVLGRR